MSNVYPKRGIKVEMHVIAIGISTGLLEKIAEFTATSYYCPAEASQAVTVIYAYKREDCLLKIRLEIFLTYRSGRER